MNGYCRISIEGQEVGLKFGYECNKWFFTAMLENTDTYTDGESLSHIGFANLFYYAYKNNCAIKTEKPLFGPEHFYNWMEEKISTVEGQKEFADIVTVWSETQNTKDIVEKMTALRGDVEEKKNLTATTT